MFVPYKETQMTKYKEYKNRSASEMDYVEKVNSNPPFVKKWGIRAIELAKQEGVSTDAIHMRVQLYGTPYQRKAKPTLCEQIHGKTDYELGMELNLHPQSVRRRVKVYGDAYRENPRQEHPLRGQVISTKKDWRTDVKRTKFWLHPKHPDYPVERGDKQ